MRLLGVAPNNLREAKHALQYTQSVTAHKQTTTENYAALTLKN